MEEQVRFCQLMREADIPATGVPVSASWHESGVPVFCLAGRMQGMDGDSIIRILRPVWDELPGNIILDLSSCEYMSSSTLGFLVNTALERFETNGQLYLCGIQRELMVLFAHMDVDQFFRIMENVDRCVLAIAKRHGGA